MSTSPSVFPFAHIALTAAITAGAALLVLRRMLDRYRLNAWQDAWSTVGPQWTDLI